MHLLSSASRLILDQEKTAWCSFVFLSTWCNSRFCSEPQCLHGPFSENHCWRLFATQSLWYFFLSSVAISFSSAKVTPREPCCSKALPSLGASTDPPGRTARCYGGSCMRQSFPYT